MVEERRTALYRHFDNGGHLLYIGIAYDPELRWRQHLDHSPWSPLVSSTQVEWFAARPDAEAAERKAIVAEAPSHNVRHRHPDSTASKDPVAPAAVLVMPSTPSGVAVIALPVPKAAQAAGVAVGVLRHAIRVGDLVPRYPTSKPVLLWDDLVAWHAERLERFPP